MAPSNRSSTARANNMSIKAEVSESPEKFVPFTPRKKDNQISAPATKSSNKRKRVIDESNWGWTHERPTAEQVAEHVRTMGRNLIPWQRPRMAEKLLLNIEYECARQGIAIPWDDIAHRFHPGATGAGLGQHFARVRGILSAEGHLIPPKLPTKKDRGPTDSTIRGYLRNSIDENGILSMCSVPYTQPLEHPTFNKADAHDLGVYDPVAETPSRKVFRGEGGKKKRSTVKIRYENHADGTFAPDSDGDDDYDADGEHPLTGMTDFATSGEPDNFTFKGSNVNVEDMAINMYTRNMNPRIMSKDPNPTYWVHGKHLTFKQVCALSLSIHQRFNYQDPECGRIIAEHTRVGALPPLGHFQMNTYEHPSSAYPDLYTPQKGTRLNDMSQVQANCDTGSANGNTGIGGYNNADPATPSKVVGTSILDGDIKGSPGVNDYTTSPFGLDFDSPNAYKSGARRAFPSDYTSAADRRAEFNDIVPDIFHSCPAHDQGYGKAPAKPADAQPTFNFTGYERQLSAAAADTTKQSGNPFHATLSIAGPSVYGSSASVSGSQVAAGSEGSRSMSARGSRSARDPLSVKSPAAEEAPMTFEDRDDGGNATSGSE